MKTFKSFLVALTLALTASVASAQVNPYRIVVVPGSAVTSLSANVTAVSTAPILLVKYVGPTTQASTFAVTTLDYIFTVAGSADATINVQATTPCGGSTGTLDTGDADCDTIGELVNEINASPNWIAVVVGALATDSTTAAGGSPAVDVVSVAGSTAAGIPVFNLSSTSLRTTLAFTPGNRLDIRDFLQGSAAGTPAASAGSAPAPTNKWAGLVSTLQYVLLNFTYSGAAGPVDIWAVTDTYAGPGGRTFSQTKRALFGSTTAATTVSLALDFSNSPLFTNPGERIVIEADTAGSHTAPRAQAFGFSNNR